LKLVSFWKANNGYLKGFGKHLSLLSILTKGFSLEPKLQMLWMIN